MSQHSDRWYRAARRIIVGLLLPVTLAFTAGCSHQGQTQVAQGKKFESGNASYDAFFEALHELQVKMAQTAREEKESRQQFARQLGLPADAAPDAIEKKIDERSTDMQDDGLTVSIKVSSLSGSAEKPTAEVSTYGREPKGLETRFVEKLKSAAQKTADLHGAAEWSEARAKALLQHQQQLSASLPRDFAKVARPRREKTEANLNDAGDVLRLVGTKAKEIATTTEALLSAMEGGLKEPPPPPPEEPAEEPEPEPKKKKWTPRKKSPPQQSAPKAAPGPSAAADDFEP